MRKFAKSWIGLAVNYALIYRFNVCAPAVQSLYAGNQTKAEIGLKVYVACTSICYYMHVLTLPAMRTLTASVEHESRLSN